MPTFGRKSDPRRKEKVMDAREGTSRQIGGDDAITTRIGAVALPLAVLVLVVAARFVQFHSREHGGVFGSRYYR